MQLHHQLFKRTSFRSSVTCIHFFKIICRYTQFILVHLWYEDLFFCFCFIEFFIFVVLLYYSDKVCSRVKFLCRIMSPCCLSVEVEECNISKNQICCMLYLIITRNYLKKIIFLAYINVTMNSWTCMIWYNIKVWH